MSEMKQGVGNEAADPRCPPHPGFIRGLCFLCGVKEEDTEGGGRTRHWRRERDDGAAPRCPPHPGFVCWRCSLCGAKVEDAGGSAPELAIGDENKMTEQGGGEVAAALCIRHPGFVNGLCSLCGAKEEDAGGRASGFAVGNIQGGLPLALPASATTSIVPRVSDLETLLRARKLTLILDLDHTLLNSTGRDDFSPMDERNGFTSDTRDEPGRGLFRMDPCGVPMLTKLRPFARGFLEQASSMFEMHVYTLAGRVYAMEAVKLLDPNGVYFGERIVWSSESTQRDMKSLKVIPGQPDPDGQYHYFASTCRTFGYDINSLAEQNRDEREHDGSLAVVLEVLKRVHKGFFDSALDGASPDVTQVIREVRCQVLLGCTVAFSRLNYMEDFAEDNPTWTLAERLGAVCEVDVGETVTHVVAEDPRTQKAQWARENNKFLVTAEWIKAASFRWCRQDEQAFPVTRGS
ncbi:RNA polymerase II C-terminal domain phosphatase-like 4 [Dichanthelium oligosanthes]|uniref:protein-serine/threonine phosphatase n=1 Tax=Dichanthelium oligosanthes TaxID=888268 RepID=A0A1E5WBK9_9POAL|nr:RNA polymerase II C-terminal domain phosphatase-like 4 [Dichanthelium oligosanthes]